LPYRYRNKSLVQLKIVLCRWLSSFPDRSRYKSLVVLKIVSCR